jgi:hypothetical protein
VKMVEVGGAGCPATLVARRQTSTCLRTIVPSAMTFEVLFRAVTDPGVDAVAHARPSSPLIRAPSQVLFRVGENSQAASSARTEASVMPDQPLAKPGVARENDGQWVTTARPPPPRVSRAAWGPCTASPIR